MVTDPNLSVPGARQQLPNPGLTIRTSRGVAGSAAVFGTACASLVVVLCPASEFQSYPIEVLEVERAYVHTGMHHRGHLRLAVVMVEHRADARTPLSLSRCRWASNLSAGT